MNTREFVATMAVGSVLLGCSLGCLTGCSSEKIVVGRQCPSPLSEDALVKGREGGTPELMVYGTTCAPCDDGDEPERDENGCLVYVTFESCGGDICLGSERFSPGFADAGADASLADSGLDAALYDGGPEEDAAEDAAAGDGAVELDGGMDAASLRDADQEEDGGA